jgi:hypothetical protein
MNMPFRTFCYFEGVSTARATNKNFEDAEASNPKANFFSVTFDYVDLHPLSSSCGEECKGSQGPYKGALLGDM